MTRADYVHVFRCDECLDTGMIDSRWCDGHGDGHDVTKRRVNFPKLRYCGDGKHHAPHSWTDRCECWLMRTQPARDLQAAQASAKPGRKARYA